MYRAENISQMTQVYIVLLHNIKRACVNIAGAALFPDFSAIVTLKVFAQDQYMVYFILTYF